MSFFSLSKNRFLFGVILLVFSCNTSPNSKKVQKDQNAKATDEVTDGAGNTFKAHLAPTSGSKYVYTISNQSATELEANGKTVNTLHKSDVGITYDVQQDSAGNFVLRLHYDKIHLYTKSGDNETELDASNAAATLDPTEKMLGLLKEANITATVSPTGSVMAISGYKELGEKILSGMHADATSRNMAKTQWEKVIGDGMVKKSIEQLFSVLPDGAMRIGDTWQKKIQQKGEIDMNVASTFTLKDIEDGIAHIESEGEMTSNKGEANVMGYLVTSDLQGDQQGEYEVETQTGMVLKNNTTSKLKGTMQMMGKEIPVTMKTTITMNGKKVQ
jgi:hypothetical protein